MRTKRFLATMLAVFLVLVQMTAAMAEAPAPADLRPLMGREIKTSTSVTYHENPLLDEATNAALQALFDAFKLSSRVMQLDEDEGYGEFVMSFGENEATSVKYVQDADSVYVVSPLLPGPVAVGKDEIPALTANLQAYLGQSAEQPVDVEAAVSAASNLDFEALMASMDEEAMNAMVAGLEEWGATYLVGETYAEEPLESMLAADAASATIYELRAPALDALVEVMLPMFTDLDAYWVEYYGMISQMPGVAEQLPSLDEFMELVHSIPVQMEGQMILPEDFAAYYAECFDTDGAPSVNIVHVYMPAAEDGTGETEFYAEWTAAGTEAVVSLYSEGNAVTLNLYMPEETVIQSDEGEVAQSQIGFLLTATMDGEQISLGLDAIKSITVKDNITETDVDVMISVGDGETTALDFDLLVCNTKIAEGEQDYTAHTLVDIAMGSEDEMFDLISFDHIIETGESAGAPFDPASDILFFFPAGLDQESFNAWIDDEVMMSITEQLIYIISVLPEEVLAAFMPAEEAGAAGAVVAP